MSKLACQLAILESVMVSVHLAICLTRSLDVKQFFILFFVRVSARLPVSWPSSLA